MLDTSLRAIDFLLCGHGVVPNATARAIERLQGAVSGRKPLCRTFARQLLSLANPRIAVITGFVVPEHLPQGENDGPLGAIILARALLHSNLRPIVYVDQPLLDTVRWLAAEVRADVDVVPIEESIDRLRTEKLGAVIAIEKPGENPRGVLHTFDGRAIQEGSLSIDALFADWRARAIPTFSIGDRGNEVGFGAIRASVLDAFPASADCACGCGGGIAAATAADVVLPAAVSNWGAYGVVAAFALLRGCPESMHTAADEARLLHIAAVRGCADGVSRCAGFAIDGLPGTRSVAFVERLQEIVRKTLDGKGKNAPVHGLFESGNEALRG